MQAVPAGSVVHLPWGVLPGLILQCNVCLQLKRLCQTDQHARNWLACLKRDLQAAELAGTISSRELPDDSELPHYILVPCTLPQRIQGMIRHMLKAEPGWQH